MKKLLYTLIFCQGIMAQSNQVSPLSQPTLALEQLKEFAVICNDQLPNLWNDLSPEERIFAYYMYRASIPGNLIFADQNHRHARELIDIFTFLITHQDKIKNLSCNTKQFVQECIVFYSYLCANHGQYFAGEFSVSKRTPNNLKLSLLTQDNIVKALNVLGFPNALETIEKLHASLFDEKTEHTITIDGSIEQSAGNMYSTDFTEEDYQSLSTDQKVGINNYFYIETQQGQRTPSVQQYKIGQKYSDELRVAHHWIGKAIEHTKKHPETFDSHIPSSLHHMQLFLETGNEEEFKNFSKEWTKTNSKIDFNFGFIEVYQDPKEYRGTFEADVTIKTVNMADLNAALPSLEQQLPFPDEFKRQNLSDTSSIPNASINAKIFASGDLGPVQCTAAYCLPNYSEIRSEHGSKQIIYQYGKGIGALTNPETHKKIYNRKEHVQWMDQYDPAQELDTDIWNMHVILHETLGHGSGKASTHTFVEGDPLTIGGTTYAIGDTIQVTNDNLNELLVNYISGHEELRAEIIALYTSIAHFDELMKIGLLKDWHTKIPKEKLMELIIIHMAKQGISRLTNQPEDTQELVQAHTIADSTIMYYLLDHGSLEIVEETISIDGTDHSVIDLKINDLDQAIGAIKELAIEVQRIKSTGDGLALDKMMKKYGTCVRYPHFIKVLKKNRNTVQGDLKRIINIFPYLTEFKDEKGNTVDISAEWPKSFIEEQLILNKRAFSIE